jgi:excisionase family DNA binding protein
MAVTKPEEKIPAESDPRAFSVKETCKRLGIGASLFWKFVGRGQIKVVRLGGRTLVTAEEIRRVLANGVK